MTALSTSTQRRMPLADALEAVAAHRRDQIVVTTMGSAREWPKLSQHPLDFHYLPSAMGQAPLIGLGLALARPRREVIVFNGDGCMLMNLGGLVSVAAAGAANYTLIVLENGIYEVTGGQSTAAAANSGERVDFAAMARAAGWASVFDFDDADVWSREIATVWRSPGPRFVCLHVAPVGADYQLPAFPSMAERIAAFQAALS